MTECTIAAALNALGFADGWAASETEGIVLWERDEPQPTETELIAAGWIKSEQETPEE